MNPDTKIDLSDVVADIKAPNIEMDNLGVLNFIPKNQQKDIFADKKRNAWDKSVEARCDFTYKLRITRRSDVNFVSIWQKSLYGRTLTDIKSDDNMVDFFAEAIAPVIAECIGTNLHKGDWAICTTPKRRHLTKNFATRISERIAEILKINFIEDVAFCHSKQRVNAVFSINKLPKEQNIIVFDDFVTTGQTLLAMKNLLASLGKNLVFFSCINNKL